MEQGYIDIHSHILPGVDDGSVDLKMTLKMLEAAYEQGIRIMIATPHFAPGDNKASKEQVLEVFETVWTEIEHEYPDFLLLTGHEIYYEAGALAAIKEGRALTLNRTRYVLVEFSFGISYSLLYHGIKELIQARYKPILAHVERYECLRKNKDRLLELKEAGVLIQLNTENFRESRFSQPFRYSLKLCREGLVDFLATDTHNLSNRVPEMQAAVKIIQKACGEEYLDLITRKNAMNYLIKEFTSDEPYTK